MADRDRLATAAANAAGLVAGALLDRVFGDPRRWHPVAGYGRAAAALGATVDLRLRWNGEQLDRLLDEAHAHLVELVASSVRPHFEAWWSGAPVT